MFFPFDGMSVKRQSLSDLPRCSRSMPPQRYALPSEVPGLTARRIAADILDGVLHKHRTLDEQLEGAGAHPGLKTLADRDRALMRRLVATILRRLGTLGHVLSRLLDRGIPTDARRAQSALLIGAAQILWMDVPDHAAVDLSVRLVQSDRRAAKYAGLVNAVLRRCAREGQPLIDEVKSQNLDIPPWLLARWIGAYGEATARQMALAIGHEPSLDITVKSDAAQWASRLHGETLPTGTSTGTIRRHPDVAWLRQEADIAALSALQKRLLQRAVALLKPGGTLVYCTCSLEPEEGEQAVASLLAAESDVRRAPIEVGEVAGLSEVVTANGDLRTLPCHLPHADPRLGGLDGFYAVRLVKS